MVTYHILNLENGDWVGEILFPYMNITSLILANTLLIESVAQNLPIPSAIEAIVKYLPSIVYVILSTLVNGHHSVFINYKMSINDVYMGGGGGRGMSRYLSIYIIICMFPTMSGCQRAWWHFLKQKEFFLVPSKHYTIHKWNTPKFLPALPLLPFTFTFLHLPIYQPSFIACPHSLLCSSPILHSVLFTLVFLPFLLINIMYV